MENVIIVRDRFTHDIGLVTKSCPPLIDPIDGSITVRSEVHVLTHKAGSWHQIHDPVIWRRPHNNVELSSVERTQLKGTKIGRIVLEELAEQ